MSSRHPEYKLGILGFLFLVVFSGKENGVIIVPKDGEQLYLVDHVNPLMGTDSKYSLSNGNTYPAIATPWGMNFGTPMTSKMGDGWDL